MSPSWNSLGPLLALCVPLALLVVGCVPTAWANARPRLIARLNEAMAWLAFLLAITAGLLGTLQGSTHTFTVASAALPAELGHLTLSIYLNALTIMMLLLVSFVGVVVSRYSKNYLAGDAQQGRFHKWLALTLASILSLIVSGNLLMFALAWIATSLSLHQLLMFYRKRPIAVLSAHKKFVASRISDASLLLAIVLIGSTLHTLEFERLFQLMAAFRGEMPMKLQIASYLIVLSAALKSAQFPLHGWLLQVMEAPTPVSALLHAGIVNAGAFLVIRMSPILSHSTGALVALTLIGLVTLVLASLVMLTQTSVKVSLAWSTTAQMGFMLLECGLGLYSLAMLHLVAHSLYKAHAFLASGSAVDAFRAPALQASPKGFDLARLIAALALGVTASLGIGSLLGVYWHGQDTLLVVGVILAVSMSQLVLQAATALGLVPALVMAGGMSALLCTTYFVLHALFDRLLLNSVLPVSGLAHTAYSVLVPVVSVTFVALLMMQQFLQASASPARFRLYVHLYNGLYVDVYVTRLLQKLWPVPQTNDIQLQGA